LNGRFSEDTVILKVYKWYTCQRRQDTCWKQLVLHLWY
jgi:hypothetical protein